MNSHTFIIEAKKALHAFFPPLEVQVLEDVDFKLLAHAIK